MVHRSGGELVSYVWTIPRATPEQLRQARGQHHEDGVLEIDNGARVSGVADDGFYIQAWVWVTDNVRDEG